MRTLDTQEIYLVSGGHMAAGSLFVLTCGTGTLLAVGTVMAAVCVVDVLFISGGNLTLSLISL